MASNKYGYMAKIGIDTTGVQNGLNEADSAMRAFSREMREVNNVIAQGGNSAEMAAQRNQLYTDQITQLNRRLEALRSVEEDINRARANHDIDESEYRAYRREIEQTEASIRRLTEEQNNLNSSTEEAAESTSRFGDVLKANIATKALEALYDVLKKAAGAMKDYALEGIQLASELVEKQNVVDVTFGSDSSKIYEFADTAAEKFGLTTLAAEQYAGTMGALFKSSGITQGIDDMSIKMAQLAADMASFYNISSDMAFEKLRSGISGESEPLKALGINLSVANLEAYALSEGINTAWKNMSQAEQTMLRYNYILSQTADAQGDFERTSDSLANQQRIMQLNLQKLQAEIGEKLYPVAQDILGLINDHMPEIQEAANYLADEMIPVIEELTDKAVEFVENGGLEDVINVLKWVVEHGDEIITVLAVMWGTEKLQGFTATLAGVPDKIANIINGFGNLSNTMMGSASAAFSNFGSTASASMSSVTTAVQGLSSTSALAFAGIAAAAIAAVGSLIILSDELNTIADGMTKLTAETKKSDQNVIDMQERWNKLSDMTGLDRYKEASAMLNDVIASEEEWNTRYKKTIDELNVLQEKKFKTADETARMKQLQNQRDSLDAEYAALQNYHLFLNKELEKYDQKTLANLERSAEEQARAQANAGKTNKQAVADAWQKIRETTKAEMEKYDDELATHKIGEKEYFAKRKAYLEAHRDEESKEWWAYYDKVNEYYEKLSEEEKKAAEKAAKEAADALKKATSDAWAAAEREQQEKGFDDEWLLNEYQKILDTLEKGSDLYLEYYDKWLKLRNDIQNEDIKEWEDSSKKTADSIKKAYEEVNKAQADAEKDYLKSMSQLGENVTEKGGKERFVLNDLDKESEKLQKYRESMDKLKATSISDDLLAGVMQFDYKDGSRQQFINELLGMSDKQREQYYKDYAEYMQEVEKTGAYDVKDKLEEANLMAAQGVNDIYANMPDAAYEQGKATANSYIQGIIDSMSGYDPLISGSFFNSINGQNLSTSGNSAESTAAGGDVVINFVVDGEVITTKVVSNIAQEYRRGGNPLNA